MGRLGSFDRASRALIPCAYMATIAYKTLGCKVNQYETEKIREALEIAGLATVPFGSRADAYVINTCSVTAVADSKSRAAVRRALRQNPEAYVVVSGCYAELEPLQVEQIEGVDLVVPNSRKESIPERVLARFAGSEPALRAGLRLRATEAAEMGRPSPSPRPSPAVGRGSRLFIPSDCTASESLRPLPSPLPQEREQAVPRSELSTPYSPHSTLRTPHSAFRTPHPVGPRMRTRAVVKVQDGCDQFCSYCVVPYARPGKRSRPLEEVVAELESLAAFGYKEIVLTGIRLGSYRDGCSALPELIMRAAGVDGIRRIRLSSIEPWEVDDALLEAMESPKVCRHLHIPLQSGDDEMLRRMNRPYTVDLYRQVVSQVREGIPGVGITTDVIAGFPGETQEAFENTCAAVREIGFSRLHVFRYSLRRQTAGAALPDQAPAKAKKARAQKLAELGTLGMRDFAASMVGSTLEVLAEREIRPERLAGFADNYVEVSFPGSASLKGEIVAVEITGSDGGGAIGEIRR